MQSSDLSHYRGLLRLALWSTQLLLLHDGIGTAFHQHPDDIAHIAVRNLGVPFYMVEMADDPRYRAIVGIENTTNSQYLEEPEDVTIPSSGEIPIGSLSRSNIPFHSINIKHI